MKAVSRGIADTCNEDWKMACVAVLTTDGDVSAGARDPLFRSQMDVHLPAPQQSESQSFPFLQQAPRECLSRLFFLQKSCSCQGMLYQRFILSYLPTMQYRIKANLHHHFPEQCVVSSIVCHTYTGRSSPVSTGAKAGLKDVIMLKEPTWTRLPLVYMRNMGKLLLIKN